MTDEFLTVDEYMKSKRVTTNPLMERLVDESGEQTWYKSELHGPQLHSFHRQTATHDIEQVQATGERFAHIYSVIGLVLSTPCCRRHDL